MLTRDKFEEVFFEVFSPDKDYMFVCTGSIGSGDDWALCVYDDLAMYDDDEEHEDKKLSDFSDLSDDANIDDYEKAYNALKNHVEYIRRHQLLEVEGSEEDCWEEAQ